MSISSLTIFLIYFFWNRAKSESESEFNCVKERNESSFCEEKIVAKRGTTSQKSISTLTVTFGCMTKVSEREKHRVCFLKVSIQWLKAIEKSRDG
jgi:hypothetical protein